MVAKIGKACYLGLHTAYRFISIMGRKLGYKASTAGKKEIEEAINRDWGGQPYGDKILVKLKEKFGKEIAPKTWMKFFQAKINIGRDIFIEYCGYLKLDWEKIRELDSIPSDSGFFGREEELKKLQKLMLSQKLRLFILYGLQGIGKATLAGKVYKQLDREVGLNKRFDQKIWHIFSESDPAKITLVGLLDKLIPQQFQSDTDMTINQLKDRLFKHLQDRKCSIFLQQDSDIKTNVYEKEYTELYYEFANGRAAEFHQSCILLITAFKKPDKVTNIVGDPNIATSLELKGIDEIDKKPALQLLKSRNLIIEKDIELAKKLINKCSGHPRTLRLVSAEIIKHHNGDIREFLDSNKNPCIPNSMKEIIVKLTDDLDLASWEILKILVDSEAISQPQLENEFFTKIPDSSDFYAAKDNLERLSLLSRYENDGKFLFGLTELIKETIRPIINKLD